MGSRRLLWILLFGLGLALVILIARHEDGTVAGLAARDFASLTINGAILVFFAGSVLVLFRQHLFKALEAVLFWALVVLVLMIGYTYRANLRDIADRVMTELVPGRPASRGRIVEIARTRTGEFPVSTLVNGARVPMVLDTGASAVVLTQEAAKAAGLPVEVLTYTVNVDTANGRTRAAQVTLDRIGVGSLTERSVPALVAQPGQLKTSLLGMSFLNRLESWEVRDDKLTLRGYP